MRRALGFLPSKSSVSPTQPTQPRTQGQRLGRTRPKGPGVKPSAHHPVPPALTGPLLLSARPAAPSHARPGPLSPGAVWGVGKVRGRSARSSGDPETPRGRRQPEGGWRQRGRSGPGAGPTARSVPPHAPPARIRRDSEGGDGNKYLDFVVKVNGNCHPGATWALGSPAPPVPGQAGRAPAPDWLAGLAIPGAVPRSDWPRRSDDQLGPIGEARGAAPLFS